MVKYEIKKGMSKVVTFPWLFRQLGAMELYTRSFYFVFCYFEMIMLGRQSKSNK